MTGPLGSWLCFPQCWLQMQMGFSSDTARWLQAAPGPHSTTFETGRKRELHLPSNSPAGIESHCTNLGHVTRLEATGHKCAPQRSGSAWSILPKSPGLRGWKEKFIPKRNIKVSHQKGWRLLGYPNNTLLLPSPLNIPVRLHSCTRWYFKI